MNIAPDILSFIERSFPVEDRAEVVRVLEGAVLHDGSPADSRCQRAALVGSRGFLSDLRALVAMLAVDFRDVIVAGEYEPEGADLRQVRDLCQPFEVDND